MQENQESIRKFRLEITYANEVDDDWLTCGFINYASHQKKG
jgi:hypothetical protein